MREVIAALGIRGEWPLIAAFVILAAYTYSSGLRAPALIAIVKDVMLYVMVLAALVILPLGLAAMPMCSRRLPRRWRSTRPRPRSSCGQRST